MLGAAVAVLVAAFLAVAPSRAGAFTGESLVIDRATSDLTGPAKTILTKPTFLPANLGEAAVFGGSAEATGVAGVLQSAGVLPVLGSVLSFGVGTVIGSEICNVIGIDGCWYFGSDGADPTPSTVTQWDFLARAPVVAYSGRAPRYTWFWNRRGSYSFTWAGLHGVPDPGGCGLAPEPTRTGSYATSAPGSCGGGIGQHSVQIRDAMANRHFEYHATDDPGISNYSYAAPSDWSRRVASELTGAADSTPEGNFGQSIAAEIDSAVHSPYKTYVEVPDCDGLIYSACEDLLERADLVPDRLSEDWRTAVIEKDAGAVLELDPVAGRELETGSTVTVITNPDEEGMPLLVLEPLEGETYADYIARLAPGLDPRRTIVAAEFTDPTTGPNGVIRTEPGAGSRADPATSTEVEVFTNSPEAPPAAGSWTAPAIPAVDLSPLAGIAIGCNDFPFGIFCWIGDGLTNWGASGRCPEVDVPFGASARIDTELPFDLCQFEPAMEIIRPILILVAAFTLAYFFAAAAMGFGGGSNED